MAKEEKKNKTHVKVPLDIPSLVAILEAGEAPAYRFFWSPRPRMRGKLDDACFSQWWPCTFAINGTVYSSAEQWMMTSKALLFGDEEAAEAMLQTDDPGRIKALGRGVRNFDQQAWDDACFDIVTIGSIEKFGQDPRLKKYLLRTGDEILVEASPTDSVWGIGLAHDVPQAKEPSEWRGLNLLGFALMRARAVLRGELDGPTVR